MQTLLIRDSLLPMAKEYFGRSKGDVAVNLAKMWLPALIPILRMLYLDLIPMLRMTQDPLLFIPCNDQGNYSFGTF